jgi:molybdopterin converting factor small subunit
MQVTQELYRIRSSSLQLNDFWREKQLDRYVSEARSFIARFRDHIRREAIDNPQSWDWINCLDGLVIVHHRLGDSNEGIVLSDEDLLQQLYKKYVPTSDDWAAGHLFQMHTASSNIYKRRAFLQARSNCLAAADQMDEAVRAAQQAVASSAAVQSSCRATGHLKFLEYYAALLRMAASEASSDFVQARGALSLARAAAEHPDAPPTLLPDYIWDKTDLETYGHLIEAQELLTLGKCAEAVTKYDLWATANQTHRGRFRFKNVEVRRNFAGVLKCLDTHCSGCTTCRASVQRLQELAHEHFIGGAGRFLAATGAALHKAAETIGGANVVDILQKLRRYLPILAYRWELKLDAMETDFASLPSYFTSVPAEARRLASSGFNRESVARFVTGRLREFVDACCEYEEGMSGASEIHPAPAIVSLADLIDRIIRARRSYRGEQSPGAASWASILTDAHDVEQSGFPEVLDVYRTVLTTVAGLFPLILRVKSQEHTRSGWWAEAETISGETLSLESDYHLEGAVGYLSSKLRQNLPERAVLLRRGRNIAWVKAESPQWIEIANIPLWEGDLSTIGRGFECQTLDYKEQSPRSVAKHLAAFANTSGGWIVFGVVNPKPSDKLVSATVKGLTLGEASVVLDSASSAAFNQVEPPVLLSLFRTYQSDLRIVLLCYIRESELAPHRVDDKIYVRLGSMSQPISDSKWANRLAG